VTCGPNALVEGIHDRMPVILRAEDADRWLAGDDAAALLVPCDAAAMEAVALGPRVNDVKNDDPGCIEPAPTTLSLPWRT
jgi:putative SOS response-associated peptidase YedK